VVTRHTLSSASEDYLKHLYLLGRGGKVSTQALADAMNVTAPSTTGMLRKLSELGLVEHESYKGAQLTPTGEAIALGILRHHRVLELYLHKALGYSLDEVHEEAERLEHVISETLVARMAEWLGHPTFDPHGDPIPALDGTLPERSETPLIGLPVGTTAKITRVPGNADVLRALIDHGLTPGVSVALLAQDKALGTVTIQARETLVLSVEVARHLLVDERIPT